jgi:hypothetical protein
MPSDKIIELAGIARRCHHAKTMRECGAGKLPAKAGRAAGDEPNRGIGCVIHRGSLSFDLYNAIISALRIQFRQIALVSRETRLNFSELCSDRSNVFPALFSAPAAVPISDVRR